MKRLLFTLFTLTSLSLPVRVGAQQLVSGITITVVPSPSTVGCGDLPALTTDVTTSGCTATLSTVNANVGSFGSTTTTPAITVNGKGLVTAVSAVTPQLTLSSTYFSSLSGTNLTALNASNLSSGTVPCAQQPALSGNVTTSAGACVTTIAAGSVTNGMLGGSIAATKLVGTDIVTLGNVTVGTWSAPSSGITRTSASGNITLTSASTPLQNVDPNGADRTVTLPTAASNMYFSVHHFGTANTITIKDSGGATVTSITTTQTATVVYDGTAWVTW